MAAGGGGGRKDKKSAEESAFDYLDTVMVCVREAVGVCVCGREYAEGEEVDETGGGWLLYITTLLYYFALI